MRKENHVKKHVSVSKAPSKLSCLRVRTVLRAGVSIAPNQNPSPETVLGKG